MAIRCNPQIVEKAYQKTGSWRKAARALNQQYGVSLSHTTWRDYAKGRNDIADPEIRSRLGLCLRVCPSCGRKHATRKQAKPKRIRAYGYPIERVRSFGEVLSFREAPR